MGDLIEAGDALAEAAASGNTGTMEAALAGWQAAKEEYVTENGVDDADVEQGDGEPGDDPDVGLADAAGSGADEPINPS